MTVRVLVSIACAGCAAATTSGPPASTSSSPPAVYQAWIARELGAVMAAQTPAQHAAIPPTTFVSLKRPASPPPDVKAVTFIVARDATFDVFETGRRSPRALTTFNADHTACVGRAERSVVLKYEKTTSGPEIEESVVLEGCPPPPNAYAVVVVEGAHPNAVLVESAKGRVVRLPSGVELPVPES